MLWFILGLVVLWLSSELFVYSSCNLAREFRVPKYIIGVLITSLGTSLPELVLSVYGAMTDHISMVIGNIVGSNIANIAVGLGLLSLLSKKGYVNTHLLYIKTDQNFLLLSTGFILVGSYLAMFGRPLGALALLVMFVFIRQQLMLNKSNKGNGNGNANSKNISNIKHVLFDIFLILVAAGTIYFGSKWTIFGGVELARFFNVNELVIGMITIALGTSLPEIAVVAASCRKGESSLALGNIIGSNIYNVCFILGLTALIKPLAINLTILSPTMIYLIILTLLVYFMLKEVSNKISGIMFILSYLIFAIWSFKYNLVL